ncbi:MAG TPA: diguanylate cyclase [Candidatus Limnocylindrales bacterium]|nr:diguanylate cyclase [Candidatus Limnocylindrales bacterium]
MRLLALLGVAAGAVAVGLLVVVPSAPDAELSQGLRLVINAIAAAMLGVSLTAFALWAYFRYRFAVLVKAAEAIAKGDYSMNVEVRGTGLDARLARAINSIGAALTDTHAQATVDRLTGVANRPALLAALFNEVERANRYERPLSVAFVDIDHFKAVNDTYGHAAGDEVLRGVAEKLTENLRATDMIGRYGGEEFMLILTETEVEDGALLTEKLRALIERTKFPVEGNPELAVTISIGLAGGFGHSLRVEPLVRDADAAMYSAKSLGRNQTYIFAEPDDDARVPRAPISTDGRARAVEVGRVAREAATAALTSAIAPLPHYRGQPSALIATIVVALARHLDLSESEVDRLKIAALLHDVGKVAVPEDILEKPAALTSAEWRTVVQHPRIGQVILEQAAALKDSVPIILHHHERYAGHGYPYGLRGSEIPMGARIVAIADAYDAMVNDRPYKRAMSHAQAIEELRRHAGTQFDPELVTVFCDLFAAMAPEPDQTVLAINASHNAHPHRRAPALAVADGTTPTVSGPRPLRHDRAAAGSGKIGRPAPRVPDARDSGRPLASVEPTSTAAADAQVRMALTEDGSAPQPAGPDLPGQGSTPNQPRGIAAN